MPNPGVCASSGGQRSKLVRFKRTVGKSISTSSRSETVPSEIAQAAAFEKAIALFRRRDFAKALNLFEAAARGPVREVAHSAQMHANMCQRRLGTVHPTLKSPEDYYLYAISLMSRGNMGAAVEHLEKAAAGQPNGDHIHYSLALCHGLCGNVTLAARHLQRAIALNGRNRAAARSDPDFHPLLSHAAIREVLSPDSDAAG